MTWTCDLHWNGKLYLNIFCSSQKRKEKMNMEKLRKKWWTLLSFNHNFQNGFRLTQWHWRFSFKIIINTNISHPSQAFQLWIKISSPTSYPLGSWILPKGIWNLRFWIPQFSLLNFCSLLWWEIDITSQRNMKDKKYELVHSIYICMKHDMYQ